ncbi:unnamed protein product, partial [Ixodes hexagonus]
TCRRELPAENPEDRLQKVVLPQRRDCDDDGGFPKVVQGRGQLLFRRHRQRARPLCLGRKKGAVMGQVWSSLWDVQLPFNCYETCHTWTPQCHQASVDVFGSALVATLPLHASLYLGSALARPTKTSWKDQLGEVVGNTLRSSVCIAYCFFFLTSFNCGSRLLLGARPLFCKHATNSETCEGTLLVCLAVALGVRMPF